MISKGRQSTDLQQEYFNSENELDEKVTKLAELITNSKHFIVFTGAGISTAAGIPDYRSGYNTVLEVGPGMWEVEKDQNGLLSSDFRIKIETSLPTSSHMALVKLEEVGLLKFLISQNVDGLHRMSGFPADKLAELHGNNKLELCKYKKCKKQYVRDYLVRNAKKTTAHETGRRCENCGNIMYDNIVNFGENLPESEKTRAFNHAHQGDLCLILGSSLEVLPASLMPLKTIENGGKVAIVNLQKTDMDSKCDVRIFGFIDTVMAKLMEKLKLDIPEFTLKRRVKVLKGDSDLKDPKEKCEPYLFLRGVDEYGDPYTYAKEIEAFLNDKKTLYEKDPVQFPLVAGEKVDSDKIKCKLKFGQKYSVPDCEFELDLNQLEYNEPNYYLLEYSFSAKKWSDLTETKLKEKEIEGKYYAFSMS